MRRRELLKKGAYAATLVGLPISSSQSSAQPLPNETLFRQAPDTYWLRIRQEQFLLPDWRVFLNTGGLGVAPRPVLDSIAHHLNLAATLVGDDLLYWGGPAHDDIRLELATFFGCRLQELALTHNTTEGMNIVANGLDLKIGDEVLMTDQEHPGGSSCWLQKQDRFGVAVRQVKIPLPSQSSEDIADRVVSAIGPRTRVLSFSGITSPTGLVLPVRSICDAARAKGVITLVDAAHMPGQVALNFHDLGCDFLACSPHKWMLTTSGCGLFYGREEMLERLWVNVAAGGWDQRTAKAGRFQLVGTNNLAIIQGMISALRFLQELTPERVYSRIHQLAREVFERGQKVTTLEVLTPDDDRMFAGMVTFRIKSQSAARFWNLCRQRRIWLLPGQATPGDRIRVSTHIHTRKRDLDLLFQTIQEGLT
jgi:isopenicillin-N epimerase